MIFLLKLSSHMTKILNLERKKKRKRSYLTGQRNVSVCSRLQGCNPVISVGTFADIVITPYVSWMVWNLDCVNYNSIYGVLSTIHIYRQSGAHELNREKNRIRSPSLYASRRLVQHAA